MMCQIKKAKTCLDIGTFTGMSALAMAEGIPEDGSVVTLEVDEKIAQVAQNAFNKSNVGSKIKLLVGSASEEMVNMKNRGDKFDVIFIDLTRMPTSSIMNLPWMVCWRR